MTTTAQASWPTQTLLPGQAAAPEGPVDMVAMYVFHHAFRRDLDHFLDAARRTPVDDVAAWRRLAARWGLFSEQLHHHHEAEDRVLWPWLRERATTAELEVLDAMEAEHDEIDPGLAAVTAAYDDLSTPGGSRDDVRGALVVRLAGVREVLDRHLGHEETAAITLVQRVTTQEEWLTLEKGFRQGQSLGSALRMVPWALHGLPVDVRTRLLRAAPPFRVVQALLGPGFERRERAAFGTP